MCKPNTHDDFSFVGFNPELSDEGTAPAIRNIMPDMLHDLGFQGDQRRAVYVTPDVLLYCHKCHDAEAPEYRLRRAGGKFIALCFKNGAGCWEQAPKPMCDYSDHQGVQCDYQAEWELRYGKDMLERSVRCLMHVAPALMDVGETRIFAL